MSEPVAITISSPPVVNVNMEPLEQIDIGLGGPEAANLPAETIYLVAQQKEPKLPKPFIWLQTDGAGNIIAVYEEGIK